ncbi:MAG: DUF2244 domain-containing protein [Pseudomonadota bacterium]
MVSVDYDDTTRGGQIVLQPNNSWTWRANLVFVGLMTVVSFSIATAFVLQGYWPILPFAGAEMLLLAWASHYCVRQTHRQEVLRFTPEELVLERGIRRAEEQHRFRRFFTRIEIEKPRHRLGELKLAVAERERREEIGAFLNYEEKQKLIGELRTMISRLEQVA